MIYLSYSNMSVLSLFLFSLQVRFNDSLVQNDPAVKKFYIPKDIHEKYYQLKMEGGVDYNLLVPKE